MSAVLAASQVHADDVIKALVIIAAAVVVLIFITARGES